MLTYVFALAVGIWFAVSASRRRQIAILWFILGVGVYLGGHFGGGAILRDTVFEGGIRTSDPSFETKLWTFAGLSVLCGLVASAVFRALFLRGGPSPEMDRLDSDGTR
jgi:hypothetical protein